jgi:hypothetical protein
MSNFDDIIRQAAKLIKENQPSGNPLIREFLPTPPRAKRDRDNPGKVSQPTSPRQLEVQSPPSNPVPEVRASSDLNQNQQTTSTTTSGIDFDDIIQEQIDVLEVWVKDNEKKSRRDFRRFWAFKTPALACSACVAAFESLGFRSVVIILGVISAFCVGIDAFFPGGRLYNVHKRAANEARRLQHDAIGLWRQAQLGEESKKRDAVSAILGSIQKERSRIDKYLTDAEASLGVTDRST